jgi:hypothetical protein
MFTPLVLTAPKKNHNIVTPQLRCKGIKVKILPVLFLTEHHLMKAYCVSGGTASRIIDLSIRWR